MKRTILSFAVLAALGLSGSPLHAADMPAPQAGKQANVSDQKTKPGKSDSVATLDQAQRLISYARDNESAVSMLAAVQMIEKVALQENDSRAGAKQSETDPKASAADSSQKKGSTAGPIFDTQKLLDEARAWAKGDNNMLALLDAESAKAKAGHTGTLGATGGVIIHHDSVQAGHFDQYEIAFNGGEVAAVGVDGDDDTDLDLYVYDENGNLVAKDDDLSDHCLVRWVPRWDGKFYIRIYNRGGVYNNYVMATN